MILALYFMFFSETLDRTMVSDEYRYNLTLFKEINRFWNMRYTYGWDVTIVNLLGNVVCFMPFGFLLPTVSRKKIFKNFLSVTFMAMLFSLGIETVQLLMKVGAFDVDDIFLNTVGGLVGYIFMKLTRVRKHI
ncbi:MAG: VanZ family protein [Eubacterium sp.]|nr:VanZ family protein [Eubacterium sp.]